MPTALPARRAGVDEEARTGVTRPGRSPALTSGAGRAAVRVGALTVCQAGLLTGLGLLITGPARDWWPLTVEDEVNEGFERIRTHALTSASFVGSGAGNTSTVVGITLLVCVGLVLVPRLPRWRETVFLATAVSLQALVFLVITESVDRTRPDVERLDASPPTSSYTSGHTGAATALYGGLAVLVLSRVRGPWRRVLGAVLLLIPLLVGVARLYRGMHHPTDVLGGLLNGGLSLLVVGRAVLADDYAAAPVPAAATDVAVAAAESRTERPDRRATGHTVVIVNPTVTGPAVRDSLRLVLAQHGRGEPVFAETTADDPGAGQAAQAVREGAGLVVVCGGDGTVRTVADALAGTGVALAVVPCGTGNLLARHLGLPLDPAKALHTALTGTRQRLDLGRLEGDGFPATHFTAMSGAGLDAAMLEHTSSRAKSAVGWPAYVLAGLRELRSPRTRLTVSLDGGPVLHRSVRMVLLANIGTVQGGAALVPAARPDDGLLDLALYDPRGPAGWLRALGVLLRPSSATGRAGARDGGPVEFLTFRRAELRFASPQPREMDGDPVGAGLRLTAEVVPGALTVLVPAGGA
ncbi:diacylglycerol kinase family protein [Streptomyces sp. NBC_00102]|uniref:diacylglycerol kinase family protein n=1 Tax=Streptomyces sp. NBC_00102 TaxID=2975652 RepID=UPI002253E1A0|nr:diacylglycerol kinase family protein [Streptomyces sp. NBC_00102]MCX5402178.1 diacylglycerol kinase family protein [Streptomyces sp. NBC_00102]